MNKQDRIIMNAKIVMPDGIVEGGWLRVEEGRVAEIGDKTTLDLNRQKDLEWLDAENGWLLPGFIDVHVHGGAGYDFMDVDTQGIGEISRFHAQHGTTGLLATSLTAPKADISSMLRGVSEYMSEPMPYAQVWGAHLEGPFINEEWKGGQNGQYAIVPQLAWLEEWVSDFPGIIRIQTLAPELDGALVYIDRLVAHGIVPSCGHTDATFDQIKEAADRGLRHAVHAFNAMRPFHHREPGTVGAVLTDDRIMAEVIADGHHVHPAGLRLLQKVKGTDRIILVTDAILAAGHEDGEYVLGGLPVVMSCGIARLKSSGNLAGSTLTMIDAFRNMIRETGLSIEEASKMASVNPAKQIGLADVTGSLKQGLRADLIQLSPALELRRVWIGGIPLSMHG
ncbi:N-acetylglucosamine-6-phosphate deacetylase [Cohnella sp. WQ 127256]|uniref:N-acetylglucosamine-6-phosphate deacetylase n=1 Tax=Cohnella sp. WQ 127256 TaxID=2938790 RepID=UPI0021199F8D|nr:N-acetylglucosamine-6-phosphate deacetylase [Cohnella sp. WQ 127256]